MKQRKNLEIRKTAIILITLVAAILVSDAAENPPHVTVYGTATTSVAVDEMNWIIRINHKNPSLEEVAKAHNSTVQEVLDFLMENELPQHCIQTSGMEFGEYFVTSKLKGRVREGYQASSSVNFKVVITSTNDNDLDRLNFIFKRLLARPPIASEQEILLKALNRSRQSYTKDPGSASQFLSVGEKPINDKINQIEHAAWTATSLAVMNLDEAVTKQ